MGRMWTSFWATIGALVVATLVLVGLARWNAPHEIPGPRLAEIVAAEVTATETALRPRVAEEVAALFAPVHAAVPAYADYHYSLQGEYAELLALAAGHGGERMREMLFDGFQDRYDAALARIDSAYAETLLAGIAARTQAEAVSMGGRPLGALTEATLDDLRARLPVTLPASGALGSAGAVVGAKVALKAAGKGAAKAAGKAAGKGAAKVTGLGGAAAAGAAAGAVLGPVGAAVGGIVGGIAAWIATDAAILGVDEALTREAFEADLHALLDAEADALVASLDATLSERGRLISGQTLREIGRTDEAP